MTHNYNKRKYKYIGDNMNELKNYIIKGIIFVSITGTLLHFVYNWSGNNTLAGIFAPVNESIWEHTKLLFFPMTLYSVYAKRKTANKYPCIDTGMIIASIIGIILIITLYYTYTGIIGKHLFLADISIFYISVLTAFFATYKAAIVCFGKKHPIIWKIAQIAIICLYIVYTFNPPGIPLFADNI